jgi:hypothetical protein
MSIISASQGSGFWMPGLRGEADTLEAAVGDVVDVPGKLLGAQTDRIDREAVLDEGLFEGDGLLHEFDQSSLNSAVQTSGFSSIRSMSRFLKTEMWLDSSRRV